MRRALVSAICVLGSIVSSPVAFSAPGEEFREVLSRTTCETVSVREIEEGLFIVHLRNAKDSDIALLRALPIHTLVLESPRFAETPDFAGLELDGLSMFDCDDLRSIDSLSKTKVKRLYIGESQVSDIGPLAAISSLHNFSITHSPVEDIRPLQALPLTKLNLAGTRIHDLSPIGGKHLTDLSVSGTSVSNLSALAGMHLRRVDLSYTPVTDISVLRGMPLERLYLHECSISDLSSLSNMRIRVFYFNPSAVSDASLAIVRRMGSLKRLGSLLTSHRDNGTAPADFWRQRSDAGGRRSGPGRKQ